MKATASPPLLKGVQVRSGVNRILFFLFFFSFFFLAKKAMFSFQTLLKGTFSLLICHMQFSITARVSMTLKRQSVQSLSDHKIESANGGTQFSVNYYFFSQILVNYYFFGQFSVNY